MNNDTVLFLDKLEFARNDSSVLIDMGFVDHIKNSDVQSLWIIDREGEPQKEVTFQDLLKGYEVTFKMNGYLYELTLNAQKQPILKAHSQI